MNCVRFIARPHDLVAEAGDKVVVDRLDVVLVDFCADSSIQVLLEPLGREHAYIPKTTSQNDLALLLQLLNLVALGDSSLLGLLEVILPS